MMADQPLKIAVIGSGAAGLTATHLLQRKHHVTLYEAADRLGGHTHTVTIPDGPDAGTPVDTGFIVMNHRNYPLLTRLFDELNVELRDSEMSFGYYDRFSGMQYSGSGLNGLLAQRMNLLKPSFHRMVRDILHFFQVAEEALQQRPLMRITLGEFLEEEGLGREFTDHHLIPMGSAIWSTPCEHMLQFPARSFLQFFHNHGLLSLKDRPQWRTVVGGSSSYIELMQKRWERVEVVLNSRIEGVGRDHEHVEIFEGGNPSRHFDHVVIATHADQALPLLLAPTSNEQRLLSPWQYTRSRVLLHTDPSVMPPLKRIWSSWNFQRVASNRTCLTYDMNRLQGLDTKHHYFVSLNLPEEPQGIIKELSYTHPMYTAAAFESREQLSLLNGTGRTWYAGSYFGNGFHEDAVRSGVAVAEALGVAL